MNILSGIISNIHATQHMALVEINVNGVLLKSIVLETPTPSNYLHVGNSVKVLFKETEVIVARDVDLPISLQNRFAGFIKEMETGELLSRLVIDVSIGEIQSVITTGSVQRLSLKPGDRIVAMVKTNEIMIAE